MLPVLGRSLTRAVLQVQAVGGDDDLDKDPFAQPAAFPLIDQEEEDAIRARMMGALGASISSLQAARPRGERFCRYCQQPGHLSRDCPRKEAEGAREVREVRGVPSTRIAPTEEGVLFHQQARSTTWQQRGPARVPADGPQTPTRRLGKDTRIAPITGVHRGGHGEPEGICTGPRALCGRGRGAADAAGAAAAGAGGGAAAAGGSSGGCGSTGASDASVPSPAAAAAAEAQEAGKPSGFSSRPFRVHGVGLALTGCDPPDALQDAAGGSAGMLALPGAGGQAGQVCFMCGSTGHLWRECPVRLAQMQGAQRIGGSVSERVGGRSSCPRPSGVCAACCSGLSR